MKHPSKNVIMATLLIPSILLMGVQKVYAATGSLLINDFQVSTGSAINVPVSVNVTGGDITSFSISITYDESVIDILTDTNIILNPLFTGTVVASAGPGISTITASTLTPQTGTIELADLGFSAVGASGATATVTVTPGSGSFVDSAAAPFNPEPTPVSAIATLVDTTPDAFSFPAQNNVSLSTPIDSAPITITGIDVPTPISINNGAEYSIDNGPFTSAAGIVNNNQTVIVRLTSSPNYSTTTTTFLRVGLGGDDFGVTTISDPAIDTVPDGFTFVNQVNVPLNVAVDSAPITVAGTNSPSVINVTGGEYSINGGVFTSAAGTVENGNTVIVRLLSSPDFLTATSAVLNIGGVADDFRVTTLAQPDTTPDPFTFIDQIDAAINTAISSSPIMVTGINTLTPITIVGGEYSINGAAFTSADGTVNNNDSVVVRQTTSSSFSSITETLLTVGDFSDIFSITTAAEDATPDPFIFIDQADVTLSTPIDSNAVAVAGINSPAPITITGGEYSINGGAFTSAGGTVNNGEAVTVRQTSSASFNTTTDVILTIGVISDTFSVITVGQPGDTTPNPFSFIDQTDIALSTSIESGAITVSGITAPTPISVVGGEYSINGGAFTSVDGIVNNGESVIVRQTSSASFTTPTTATLSIGGISDDFTVTTAAEDTLPDPFTLSTITEAPLNTIETSNTITVTGINSPSPATITGGEYSINGGPYTPDPVLISQNDTVTVRLTSAANFATTSTATLTIGGVSSIFSVTTVSEDSTPDQFIFVDQTDITLSTIVDSNPINVTGINVAVPISIVGGEYSISGGAFTSAGGTVNNSETVTVRQTSSASFGATTTATLTISGINDNFDMTTIAQPINGAPVLGAIATQNALVNSAVTFTAVATDPNGDTLTFSLANAPTGAVIDPVAGVFSWTPSAIGTFTFDVIASDATASDTESVTINVSETPQIPAAVVVPVVVPVVAPAVASINDNDHCGDTCEKYKELRKKYRNDESKKIYVTLKEMKKSDPTSFFALEAIYRNHRDLSDRELKMLDPKIQSQFKLFKSYDGYKNYRNLKERVH